jgi:hypothetical protein
LGNTTGNKRLRGEGIGSTDTIEVSDQTADSELHAIVRSPGASVDLKGEAQAELDHRQRAHDLQISGRQERVAWAAAIAAGLSALATIGLVVVSALRL